MKGNYALALCLLEGQELDVGKLGRFPFAAGYYLYFGSALNSLEGRLRRHLIREKKQHWHIDFLTAIAPIREIWWTLDDEKKECSWTQLSLENPRARVPVPKFGSSDCRVCPSHLVYTPSWRGVEEIRQHLEQHSAKSGLHVGHDLGNGPLSLPEIPGF